MKKRFIAIVDVNLEGQDEDCLADASEVAGWVESRLDDNSIGIPTPSVTVYTSLEDAALDRMEGLGAFVDDTIPFIPQPKA